MAKHKKTSGGVIAAEIGAGLAAVGAAAAAGYYFYGSKQAKKHRKAAAKWAHDLKNEVLRETGSLEKMDAEDIAKVVDTVAAAYRGVRSINAADLRRASNELKSNWKLVQMEAQKTARAGTARAKTVGKRVLSRSKKTVKKIVRKAKKSARKGR